MTTTTLNSARYGDGSTLPIRATPWSQNHRREARLLGQSLYETLFDGHRVRYPAGSTGMGGCEGPVATVGRILVRR